MRLSPGNRLGPYEILAPIGAGGMGEVYRARDTRLDRTVAIKVMPEALAANAQLRERFEREARTISSLAHPNICTLHDVGTHDGLEYLVMEHLEGETLAERLTRGPLPLPDTLIFATQIADALDKAHRRGIVHRDLKPGNVMLTRTGAKLLDFGLAKSFASATGSEQTALPTEQKSITEQGTILGTYQYMAPEQLEGTPADARTDIFAFGALLYEMATGLRAFSGKTRTSLIAAIVSSEPRPISEIQPLTPASLERLVRGCLAKDPDQRWQSAHDVKLELESIAATMNATPQAARSSRTKAVTVAGWIVATLIAIAATGWTIAQRRQSDAAQRRFQFEIASPGQSRFDPDSGPVALSPDGRHLIVRTIGTERQEQIWLRSLDSIDHRPLRGTERSFDHFWSPDGRHIGFFVDGKLRRLELSTSTVSSICDASDSRGATWSPDGTILISLSTLGPLYRVPANGGKPVAATKLDAGRKETAHWRPSFLPDGKRFLFMTLSEDSDQAGVYLGSLDSSDVKRVLNFSTPAVYADPGYLLYINENDLYAQPFDADKGSIAGEGVVLARGVSYSGQYASAAFSVSPNGTLAYHRYSPSAGAKLSRMPIDGDQATPLPVDGVNLDLSRDGTRVALMRFDGQQRNSDIWTYDLRRNVSSRLTFEGAEEVGPVWSPDGKTIVYVSVSAGGFSVRSKSSSGGGEEKILFTMRDSPIEIVDWSPDGRTLIGEAFSGTNRLDLVTVDIATGKITPFVKLPSTEASGRFSPDGRWIAYRSDESGASELYVQPFPPDGNKWQVSAGGGESPRWTADGRRLFFAGKQATLMSVDVSTANGFETTPPRPHRRLDSSDIVLTPDGKEVITSVTRSLGADPIVVMTDWRPR